MAIDPKSLSDEEFARAFQQMVRGEEPTGKKWRPAWKTERRDAAEARKLLRLTVEDFIMGAPGASGVHRTVTKRAKRLLPHELNWGGDSATMKVGENRYTLLFHKFRSHSEFGWSLNDPERGAPLRPSIALDLSYLYKLLRGTDEFAGRSVTEVWRACRDSSNFIRHTHYADIAVVEDALILPKSGASDVVYEDFQARGFNVRVSGAEEELAQVVWRVSDNDKRFNNCRIGIYVG